MEKQSQPKSVDKNSVELDYYRLVGEFYGYPTCCIEAFTGLDGYPVFFIDRSEGVKKAVHTMFNHGFIPCEKCAALINEGKATLGSLITNRICTHPFPSECRTQLKKYLADKEIKHQYTS